jgi:predicted nucleotidyltransferase/DNA-binding XRE family transcriptional regulator
MLRWRCRCSILPYRQLAIIHDMTSGATTIRAARERAGLTQAELAGRADVSQGVVSVYESGKREPSIRMIQRLVEAAGFDLSLTLTPAQPKSHLQVVVMRNRARLVRELRALGATNLRLFGSVGRGEDVPCSDIDLLVDVDQSTGLFALGLMRSRAEEILGTSVDIVPADGLKADAAARILSEATPI